MGTSAAEHSKCVSIFENDKEEMNEHPLAFENGNADTGCPKKKKKRSLVCKYSAFIMDGITLVSSGIM